jgi:hypothetical protein
MTNLIYGREMVLEKEYRSPEGEEVMTQTA